MNDDVYYLRYGSYRGETGPGYPFQLEQMAINNAVALSRPDSFGGPVTVVRRNAGGGRSTIGIAKNGKFTYASKGAPRSSTQSAKAAVRRLSTMSGYAYVYIGRGDPLHGANSLWITAKIYAEPASVIGKRKIDGVEHYVLRVDRNGRHSYYAQTTASLK